jgi:triacylglycerol lipase
MSMVSEVRAFAAVAREEVEFLVRCAVAPVLPWPPLPTPKPKPGRPPVLLVHGYLGHPEMLHPLAAALLANGAPRVERVQYDSLTLPFEEIVAAIAGAARALNEGQPVDLVGHSLGAVACQAWIKLYGGAPLVRRFVSLGGPHGGTSLYRLVPSPVRAAFDPRGGIVRRLAEGDEPVPTTVVRAQYDHQVFPPRRARLAGIEERVIGTHGHNSLLWSADAHEAVNEALSA